MYIDTIYEFKFDSVALTNCNVSQIPVREGLNCKPLTSEGVTKPTRS